MQKEIEIIHRTELVNIDEIKFNPRNYQEHPNDELAHIAESLAEHGQYKNVVLAKEGTLLAGHGVIVAAKRDGYKQVTAVRMDLDPEDPRALQIMVADNEIAKLAQKDITGLSNLLQKIQSTDPGKLLGTGYDEMMLSALKMIAKAGGEDVKDPDNIEKEWVDMPEFIPESEPVKLTVNFMTEEDRFDFIERFRLKNYLKFGENRLLSAWWPPKEQKQDDAASVKFTSGESS